MLLVDAETSRQIARELFRRHGRDAGTHAVRRLRELQVDGGEAELATWLGVMAELAALLAAHD